MYYLIMSKKYYFIILFKNKNKNKNFKNLLPPSSSITTSWPLPTHHGINPPPTGIEPMTSSSPRTSPNSPLTHQVPSHKPPNPHAHESF
jgi:hypothetical protein